LPANPAELARVFLNNLTGPLWESYPETLKSITARFEQKWKDRPPRERAAKVASSVSNSKKRSAGTNFQTDRLTVRAALVHLLEAGDILQQEECWLEVLHDADELVEKVVPRIFGDLLARGAEPLAGRATHNHIEVRLARRSHDGFFQALKGKAADVAD
jgi:hypothetical protein